MRRDIVEGVGGFSERFCSSLDYGFWLRILAETHQLAPVPRVLAYHRWHGSGQISANRHRQILDAWRVRRDFVRHFPEQVSHLPRARRRVLVIGAMRSAAYEAFWRRDLPTAQALFRHALLHRALNLKDLRYALSAMLPERTFAALVGRFDRPKTQSEKPE